MCVFEAYIDTRKMSHDNDHNCKIISNQTAAQE